MHWTVKWITVYILLSDSIFFCKKCGTICIYVYTIIHRSTVSLYYYSQVWLDTRDASNWDQNPPSFTSCQWHTYKTQRQLRNLAHMYQLLFVCILSATQVLNSFEELCMTQMATVNFFAKVFNPLQWRGAYIVIYRQTVSLYHNSSVWLDTWNASSRDRNPPNYNSLLNA